MMSPNRDCFIRVRWLVCARGGFDDVKRRAYWFLAIMFLNVLFCRVEVDAQHLLPQTILPFIKSCKSNQQSVQSETLRQAWRLLINSVVVFRICFQ